MSALLSVALPVVLVLGMACSKPPDTPESKRIAEIQAELDSINQQLKSMAPGTDQYDKLNDKRMELNAEKTNIMQKADKARQQP